MILFSAVRPAFIKTLFAMISDGSIFYHTAVTVAETGISFALIVLLGVGTAILLWSSKTVSAVLEPYLVLLNSLPKSALAPMIIVWFGNNVKAIIVTAISVGVFGTILNIYTSFAETDSDKILLIQTLGGSRKNILTKVVLPASLKTIISNMKSTSVSVSWVSSSASFSPPGRPWLPHHLRQPGL